MLRHHLEGPAAAVLAAALLLAGSWLPAAEPERRVSAAVEGAVAAALERAALRPMPKEPCAIQCGSVERRQDLEPFVKGWGVRGAGLGLGLAAGLALGEGAQASGAPALRGGWRVADSLVAGATVATWGATRLFDRPPDDAIVGCAPGCAGPVDTLNGLDRHVARALGGGRGRRRAGAASDLTLFAATGLPLGLALGADAAHRGRDLAVTVGAFVVNFAFVDVAKRLVDRPRPYAHYCRPYRPDDLCGDDAHYSFYSGHTSGSFSMAVTAGMLSHYHGYRNEGWVWATGLTLATTTAVLRIAADEHYLTDVAAGAAAGAFVGWLIPRIHRPERSSEAVTGAGPPPAAVSFPLRVAGLAGQGTVRAGIATGPFLEASWHW